MKSEDKIKVSPLNERIAAPPAGEQSVIDRMETLLSPLRLMIITAVSIFVAETLIMFILHTLPSLSKLMEGLLDALALTVIVFPVLYLFLFRPLILHINRRRRAEEALRKAHDELEVRVVQRTAVVTTLNKALQHEIADRKRNETELNLLLKVTLALSEAEDFHSALCTLLREVCGATSWIHSEVWLPRADGACLERSPSWYSSVVGLAKFIKASEALTFPPGVGLPGRVWSSKRPAWVYDITAETNFLRAPFAREAGLKAAVGIPVLTGDKVVAVMEFFQLEPREEDERFVSLISAVAAQVGSMMQRKRAEEELRQSEERFRSVAQSATDAIILADGDGNVILWNKSAHTMFGYSEEEVLGKSSTLLIPERYREAHQQGMERYRSTGEAQPMGKTFEIQGLRKDGSEFPVEISLSGWKKENSMFHSGIIRDVTERKRAEKEREKLVNDLQDAFINIKTLDGLIPICASCKNIRDDQGYWTQVEQYVMEHSDAMFSHSVCPQCLVKLYPEYADQLVKKSQIE